MKKTAFTLLLLIIGIWCMENREKVSLNYDLASTAVKRFLWGTKSLPAVNPDDTEETPVVLTEPQVEGEPQTLKPPATSLFSLTEELAPDLYFTKERLSMMSDEGIKAIAECMMVQKIGEQDGKFIVKDEKVQLIVDPWKLTRNPEEISELKKRAAALQASVRPVFVAPVSGSKKTGGNTSGSKSKASTLISSERAQIEAQISSIDRQIASLGEAIAYKQQAELAARKMGKSSSHGVEIGRLRTQILSLEKQRAYYSGMLK